jgi:uncharacterized membrane protein YcgQ (UPF0703/DUF1980 family)
MQSLKYIIPVIAVLILISAGMYYFGDQISASGPDNDGLDSTIIDVSQEEGDQRVPKKYEPQESKETPGYYDISWVDLADVKFEPKYYKEADQNLLFPTFGPRPLALKDKPITLPGYVLPTDVENDIYVLSAFTMSSCFFCGAAGPESVVQLKFKPGHREYKMDEWITFKGTLRLNDSDIDQLNYIIEDAEEVEE